ncbi:DUF1376 domain-containing protein [Achromobacter xylosoxidans]|nr:DUF1376 domain-containing protein [Achromobacter xylosoxidans]
MTEPNQLPAPLTPPDCNLRGLPFMPLHTERLLDSDMMALSTGEEFKTALRLWCKSWNQEPAASLPDDDRILAHLAGKELPAWRKVKDMALRGFVKCADGRLYHPVIAAEAIKAMAKREEHQAAKDGDNERKREEREDRKLLFAALRDIGVILSAKGTSTSQLREVAASRGISIIVTEGHKVVTVTPKGSHKESHGGVTAKTGTGTGTYIKEQAAAAEHSREGDPVDNPAPPPAAGVESTAAHFAQLLDRWERERGKSGAFHPGDPLLLAWADAGVTNAELQAAHTKAVKRRVKANDQAPVNVGLLDAILPEVRVKPGVTSAVARAETRQDPAAWALTWSGLVARGAELGIVQQQGELDPVFKARVHTAAGLTDADRARLFADYGVRV